MLTDEEKATFASAAWIAVLNQEKSAAMLMAIIDRLTSPRAVLGEAERLLAAANIETVHVYENGCQVELAEFGELGFYSPANKLKSLADAYEALKEGEL